MCCCSKCEYEKHRGVCLQVPEVAGFQLNVSIGSMSASPDSDFEARMTFPLFVGGERQLQGKWVANGSLPAGMADQYTDEQLELLCVSEVIPKSCCLLFGSAVNTNTASDANPCRYTVCKQTMIIQVICTSLHLHAIFTCCCEYVTHHMKTITSSQCF